ncbi:MAG: BREX-3 system P-loop-containing protein BrxF [Deltaproteobacteria bacterium]|nr:BREX-3 system P-loop-containing protein BrxF [Deltaproteobacteria bacterium]
MPADGIPSQIIDKIEQAIGLYHRLVLVVAPSGAGKTDALKEVHRHLGAPFLNVNLEISRRMLDLTVRQRALQVSRLVEEILGDSNGEVVLLDNMEILFDPSLQQDPLRLLLSLSRNRTLVVSWNGEIKNNTLSYGEPGHPEYQRYTVENFLVITPDAQS